MANAKVIISAQSELDKGLNKAKSQLQDFERAAGTVGDSISSMISKHAGISLLVGSITALGAAAKKCADEYIGVARENDRFTATMENLAKTTGVEIRELGKLANAYEQTTFFTAEAVQAAGQLLLATNEISKDVFPRALQATVDLAEALGQDVSSAASQMQKALAEPEEGLRALRTAGIHFTESEEDLIKSLIDSNKKLEAQELILKKVEDRYAGVAKAVADTPVGKLDAIKDTWGALKEGIGEKIVNDLDPVFTWIHQQLDSLNKRLERRNEIELFTTIQEQGRLFSYSDYEEFKAITDSFVKGLDGAQTRFLNNFNLLREWGYDNDIHIALDTEDAELLQQLETYGIKVDIDQETGKFIIPELDRALRIIEDYQSDNPSVAVMGMSNDSIKNLIKELEEENAHLARLIEATQDYTSEVVASSAQSWKTQLEQNEKQLEILKTRVYNPPSTPTDSKQEVLWIGEESSVNSSNITPLIPTSFEIDFSEITEPQQRLIDETLGYLEDTYLQSLSVYDREIYAIEQMIGKLESIDILSPFKEQATLLISFLQDEIAKINSQRDKEKSDENKDKINQQTTLYEQARVGEIEYKKRLQEDARKAYEAKEKELRKIEEEALLEEKRYRQEQINLYQQAFVGQAEYLKNLQEDARKAREEYDRQQASYKAQWETEGFSGLDTLFEMMGKEMDVFGAFTAEFGRTRELGFDSLLGPLDTLLGALDPILDIVLSSNPILAALLPIIEAFVNVIASAIDTTIAPLMDFLTEIGTLLGEVFLPIFDALRPSLDMIAEILRMFITPVLQILEPIISAVVLAFDLLSPAIAAVGIVLTPLAAALEFVMDMFGYLGNALVTLGENIGIAFYNLTHWFDTKSFKTIDPFKSDAFDNFGEKMDKWFTMMEDDQVVSDSVSQQIATTNATYTGATTVHMNIYQNAPVVGENGMEQFAIMIRDKFEELNYFAA